MRLCDEINGFAENGMDPRRSGAPAERLRDPYYQCEHRQSARVAQTLRNAARFILSDEVIEAATHLVLSRPRSLRDCVDALKIGWPAMWIEWSEPARVGVRRLLGASNENTHETHRTMGFLLRASEDGRRGVLTFVWSHGGDEPLTCPIEVAFDLDLCAAAPHDADTVAACLETDIGRRWRRSPDDIAALLELERCVKILHGPELPRIAETVLEISGGDQQILRRFLDSQYADIDGEFLASLAILLLLTSRNGPELRREDRARLNKSRAKQRKIGLLSHDVVYLRLSRGERVAGERVGGGTIVGASRRAHTVRGHLVNRGGVVYWRRAHVRGTGPATPTTTVVTL